MAKKIDGHAVVLGASMAGLLAARVLSDAYERVTVVERDELPDGPVHRRGVPQARHVHGLLPRGCGLLEDLFPGLLAELVAAGAHAGGALEIRGFYSGHRLAPPVTDLKGLGLSRPLLESRIRARVRAIPTVTIREACDAVGVVPTPDRRRVCGVRLVPGAQPAAQRTLEADLVVDATGRGSRTPTWLAQLGFPEPRRDRMEVGVRYGTRAFRLRQGALGQELGVVIGETPSHPRHATILGIEGGVHLCSLAGFRGDFPPIEPAGFLHFAGGLAFPDVRDALVGAEPLDGGATYGFPANVRVRYERLSRHPTGLLVIGDAICALNPIYGQGMTVAAMQAETLAHLLRAGAPFDPGHYFTEMARTVDVPWDMTAAADLARSVVAGRRSLRLRLVNAYISRLHAAAESDPDLTLAFIRVGGLLDPPSALVRPGRVVRVLKGGFRGGGQAVPATTSHREVD